MIIQISYFSLRKVAQLVLGLTQLGTSVLVLTITLLQGINKKKQAWINKNPSLTFGILAIMTTFVVLDPKFCVADFYRFCLFVFNIIIELFETKYNAFNSFS